MSLVIAIDDARADDVGALIERHLAFAREVTPPGHVHALPAENFSDPAITLFGARRDGELVAIGALKRLDEHHVELKAMHTAEAARGAGVGSAMVEHLLAVAAERRYERVSLETGTMAAFAPARRLYAKAGFTPCEPFGGYTANPHSVCMMLDL